MPTSKAQLQHRIEDAKRLGWHGDKIAAILDILELMAKAWPEQSNGKMVDPIADIVKLPREAIPNDEKWAESFEPIQSMEVLISIDTDEPDTCSFGEAQKAARASARVECKFKPTGIWFKVYLIDSLWTFRLGGNDLQQFDPSTATAWRILEETTEAKPGNGASDSTVWTGDEES